MNKSDLELVFIGGTGIRNWGDHSNHVRHPRRPLLAARRWEDCHLHLDRNRVCQCATLPSRVCSGSNSGCIGELLCLGPR